MQDLDSCARKGVQVQLLSIPPNKKEKDYERRYEER